MMLQRLTKNPRSAPLTATLLPAVRPHRSFHPSSSSRQFRDAWEKDEDKKPEKKHKADTVSEKEELGQPITDKDRSMEHPMFKNPNKKMVGKKGDDFAEENISRTDARLIREREGTQTEKDRPSAEKDWLKDFEEQKNKLE